MRLEAGDALPDLLALGLYPIQGRYPVLFSDGALRRWSGPEGFGNRHRFSDERIEFSFPIGHGKFPLRRPYRAKPIAVLVPAGQPSVNGRDGIEEWGEVATKVWNHLEIQQGRCSADGNVVWEQGTWTGNINLPDKQTMDISGNFLLLAEKEGPALRIKAHTWSVNPTTQ